MEEKRVSEEQVAKEGRKVVAVLAAIVVFGVGSKIIGFLLESGVILIFNPSTSSIVLSYIGVPQFIIVLYLALKTYLLIAKKKVSK